MAEIIDGLKLISHTGGKNIPDDPTYPYRLDVSLRPPELMFFAFVALYGNEDVVVRGLTLEAIEKFVSVNMLDTHPRLIRLVITGPEGEIRKVGK